MKIKLLLYLFVFLIYSTSYASFPVKRTITTYETAEVLTSIENVLTNTADVFTPVATTVAGKDKWVGVALWFFLGWPFAAHRWYYNKPTWANILFILTIGGLGIWAIVDLINMLTDNF